MFLAYYGAYTLYLVLAAMVVSLLWKLRGREGEASLGKDPERVA